MNQGIGGLGINWYAADSASFLTHPLYLKYSSGPLSGFSLGAAKSELAAMAHTQQSAHIIAYMQWIIRSMNLAGIS